MVHDEKLFILGGVTGTGEPITLDEICYLDLKTWIWSRSWSFIPRYDHSVAVWGGRMWIFGGLGPDSAHSGELWWIDMRNNPAFKTAPSHGAEDTPQIPHRSHPATRPSFNHFSSPQLSTGHAANTSSIQIRTLPQHRPIAPGILGSTRIISGPNVPTQQVGAHFHAFSSGALLDFITGASTGTLRPSDCSLSALELSTFQWEKLAEGAEIFEPGYAWRYCVLNEDGTKAWLLGCPLETADGLQGGGALEEYLSEIMTVDLRRYGLLGRDMTSDTRLGIGKLPASDRHASSSLSGLGADLASMFDQPPESGSGADFIITAERDDPEAYDDEDTSMPSSATPTVTSSGAASANVSPPIHVHKLILQARWPHFCRVYAAQMAEFHTQKMHLEEPYRTVRAFTHYLYTDSIARHPEFCPSLHEVAGLLVLAHLYDMPRLRMLCVHRLSRELDVESAACVWERAGAAQERWLQKRAATFCMTHWGRVVRTEGFRRLSRGSMMELCEVIDVEGRVVGGEELEVIGGLDGGKLGVGGVGRNAGRHRGTMSMIDVDEMDADEDEGMIDLT